MRGILEGHFGAYLGEAMVGAGKRRRNMDEHTTGQRDERDWADRHHVGLIRQSIRNDILEVAGGGRRAGRDSNLWTYEGSDVLDVATIGVGNVFSARGVIGCTSRSSAGDT